MAKNLTLIFPVRNEKENLKILLPRVEKLLDSRTEIIIVDDGSNDGLEEIKDIFSFLNLKIVKNRKRGLASAIDTGIKNATTEIICWMDADLSMPVELIPEMVKFISEYAIVVGSRYICSGKDKRNNRIRVLTSKLFNLMSKKILNTETCDLTSGFIAIRKEVLKELKIEGKLGEYFLNLIFQAEKKGFRIKEIPYIFQERRKGKSKIAPTPFVFLRNSLFYLRMLLRLKFCNLFSGKDNKVLDKET
ncbi:MAG: glycosyltransferase [Candidatus Omnitrophica bacterium]|nr:glycosyltransferase [Candidatus Omnitrophota bacterium]